MAEGGLMMSVKERTTLVVMERVKRKEMKLVEAAEVLGISYRRVGGGGGDTGKKGRRDWYTGREERCRTGGCRRR